VSSPHPALVDLAAGRGPGAFPDVDDGLLASALDHGMHGLLWSWVRIHAPHYSERIRLAGVDAATRQRHERIWATFAATRAALDEIGVDVAAVKGVAAEAQWYGRMGERPCSDVDVLVDPAATDRAGEILAALDPDHPLCGDVDALVRSHAMQSVNLQVDGVAVDLHFDLLKLGYPLRDPDRLWRHTREVTLAGRGTVRVLDPEAALVHFLVHCNKDSFPQLLGYADIARILRYEDLDWGVVETMLRAEGLEVLGSCSLVTVTDALGLEAAPLPAAGGVRAQVWRAVWPTRVTLLGATGTDRSRRQEAIPYLVRGRLPDAFRATARILLPPAAAVAVRYPDVPGRYLTRLTRGRVRTMRGRRVALRARRTGDVARPEPTPRDPTVTARLLRTRAGTEPLWLPVTGRSMGRSIPGGARVRVTVDGRPPRRGQVWAFCNERGEIVVHRNRGTGPGGHRFQGDACIRSDSPVASQHLIGRVTAVEPARSTWRWSAAAGAVQRVPRRAVAEVVRRSRQLRPGAVR
jgi:hypothetical protein